MLRPRPVRTHDIAAEAASGPRQGQRSARGVDVFRGVSSRTAVGRRPGGGGAVVREDAAGDESYSATRYRIIPTLQQPRCPWQIAVRPIAEVARGRRNTVSSGQADCSEWSSPDAIGQRLAALGTDV